MQVGNYAPKLGNYTLQVERVRLQVERVRLQVERVQLKFGRVPPKLDSYAVKLEAVPLRVKRYTRGFEFRVSSFETSRLEIFASIRSLSLAVLHHGHVPRRLSRSS